MIKGTDFTMKTLIIYSSTYGFAESCAKKLAEKLGSHADTANAAAGSVPALDGYDTVIIGGSIYMGQISKKLKEFMASHTSELKTKKLGLFLCSGLAENLEQNFSANFPKELLDAAVAREYFGGVLDKSKMSFGHKMITKMMEGAAKKEGKSEPAALPGNIDKLAAAMN
jgi:menaquinone-dependent protoporphyrinogen oxidase